jgi:hypothetical protein
MPSECVFCKRDLRGEAAEEHIFPKWLLRHLGIPKTDKLFQASADAATLDIDESEARVHGTWRFVEGNVCKDCNGGWMRRLEDETAPGLKILMKEGGRIVAFSAPQRKLLARWAAKTAFLIANVAPFDRPVPPGHLWAMNDGGDVPPGVFAYAGQSGTNTRTAYIQSTMWPQIHSTRFGIRVGAMSNAYKIGLQIQDLLLLVAFTPQSGVEFATAAGIHVPLNNASLVWPCHLYEIPPEPQPPLWQFTRSLGAVIRS